MDDGISTTLAHVIQDHMTITLASANYNSAEVAQAHRASVRRQPFVLHRSPK